MCVEPSLKGKSALILVPNFAVYQSIERMFQSCSGETLEPKPYEKWLNPENNMSTDVFPEIIPDFIVIDQQDPNISMLDSKWPQWCDGSKPTPVFFY